MQTREAREIRRGFGVARAAQHAPIARGERIDMARLHEVGRLGFRVGQHMDGLGAVGRADAGGDAVLGVHSYHERRLEGVAVAFDHARDAEPGQVIVHHCHAEQPARVLHDEIDRRGRDLLGGHDEVAFVLTLLVVRNDHQFAGADILNDRLYRIKRIACCSCHLLAHKKTLKKRSSGPASTPPPPVSRTSNRPPILLSSGLYRRPRSLTGSCAPISKRSRGLPPVGNCLAALRAAKLTLP